MSLKIRKRWVGITTSLVVSFVLGIMVAPHFDDPSISAQKRGSLINDYFQSSEAYKKYGESPKNCSKIKGMSMAPSLFPGNTVCYAKYDRGKGVVEGDIIVFERSGSGKIAHTVISKKKVGGETVFVTKGYNNRLEDPSFVKERDVLGVATEVRFT